MTFESGIHRELIFDPSPARVGPVSAQWVIVETGLYEAARKQYGSSMIHRPTAIAR